MVSNRAYNYRAKQGPGKTVTGTVEAESPEAAVRKIERAGLVVVEVSPREDKRPARERWERLKLLLPSPHKVVLSEVVVFTRQLSDLTEAGVPVLKALTSIRLQMKRAVFGRVIDEAMAAVRDGAMLSEALSRHPGIFPPVYTSLVKAGELSGSLKAVLKRLADFEEQEEVSQRQLQASLVYPLLILIVGSGTVFVLLTWVIPRLTTIFEDLGGELPLPTQLLLSVSDYFSAYWWLLLSGTGVLAVVFQEMISSRRGRLWWHACKLKLPLWGNFFACVELERFARTLGTLLENRVEIVAALRAVSEVLENVIFREAVGMVEKDVTRGKSLTQALSAQALFPDTVIQMVSVGEQTGAPHEALTRLSAYYEREVQRFSKTMLSLVEPLLILALGLVVGFVVLSLLMPVFRMNLLIH